MNNDCEHLVTELQARLPYQNNAYLRSPHYFRSCLQDHNFDLGKAEAAILKTYKWREGMGIESILNENFDDIFIPFDYEFTGFDLQGRPILTANAKDLGKKANAKMHQAVKDGLKDKERTMRWAFFMGESILQAIADASTRSPNQSVDSIIVIVDQKGVQVMEFFQYVPLILPTALPLLSTCREHFSGIVHKMYVINGSKAPARLGIQMVKGQSPGLEDRVKILGKKKFKWQKVLLENIAPDQLSERFGGTRPEKDPGVVQLHIVESMDLD